MKSQDINLLTQVVNAITNLYNQGQGVNVKVISVTTQFPDGSGVIFTCDDSTPETDWHINTAGGSR